MERQNLRGQNIGWRIFRFLILVLCNHWLLRFTITRLLSFLLLLFGQLQLILLFISLTFILLGITLLYLSLLLLAILTFPLIIGIITIRLPLLLLLIISSIFLPLLSSTIMMSLASIIVIIVGSMILLGLSWKILLLLNVFRRRKWLRDGERSLIGIDGLLIVGRIGSSTKRLILVAT